MKTVSTKSVLDFLDSEGISHQCSEGVLKEEYAVASLFDPVKNGVYFFTGNQLPETISGSLLILREDSPLHLLDGNIGLYVDQEPQRVFYKLLSSLFKPVSTGEKSSTAIIDKDAVIGENVEIGHFSIIGKAVIGDNTIIRSHCYVHNGSLIGNDVIIENHSIIGAQGVAWVWNNEETEKIVQPQLGGVEIKNNCFLGANTIIVRGSLNENSYVGENTLFAPGCRIGHGTVVEDFVHFANNIVTGGNTHIGSHSFIGSAAVFRPKVTVHENTIVGAGAVVVKNTTGKGKTLVGVPAKEKETKVHPKGMPKPKSINN